MVTLRVQANIRAVVMAALAVTILCGVQVSAVTASTKNNATNILKISPLRSDITIAAGSSKTVPVTVTNVTNSPITISTIENDFVAADENGTPALILNASQYAPTHSLKRFMQPVGDTTIAANQAKVINVTINVPQGAQAGGYFGAVRFTSASGTSGGQVNLDASAASIMLLTVPGPTTEKLTLTDFNIQQNDITNSVFQTPDNLQVAVRFQNQGNLQEGPFGTVSVKNGNKVVYDGQFNNQSPHDTILPDSARKWTIPLKDVGSFGHYTVVATFTYGANNTTINVTKSFWVIPKMMILAAAIGVVVLIALIVGIWLFLRGYKRRILKSSGMGRHRR